MDTNIFVTFPRYGVGDDCNVVVLLLVLILAIDGMKLLLLLLLLLLSTTLLSLLFSLTFGKLTKVTLPVRVPAAMTKPSPCLRSRHHSIFFIFSTLVHIATFRYERGVFVVFVGVLDFWCILFNLISPRDAIAKYLFNPVCGHHATSE